MIATQQLSESTVSDNTFNILVCNLLVLTFNSMEFNLCEWSKLYWVPELHLTSCMHYVVLSMYYVCVYVCTYVCVCLCALLNHVYNVGVSCYHNLCQICSVGWSLTTKAASSFLLQNQFWKCSLFWAPPPLLPWNYNNMFFMLIPLKLSKEALLLAILFLETTSS